MTEKLLPCPFCGGEAVVTHVEAHDHTPALKLVIPGIEPAEDTYWPECPNCGGAKSGSNSQTGAVEAWNTRVGPAPEAPTRDQLAQIIDPQPWQKHGLGGPYGAREDLEYAKHQAYKTADAILAILPQRSAVTTVDVASAIYQCMATDDDPNSKDVWMDVTKLVFDDISKRPDIRSRILYAAPLPSTASSAEPVQLYELPEAEYAAFVEALGGNKPPTQALIDLMRGYADNQKRATPPSVGNADAVREELAEKLQQFWQAPSGRSWNTPDDEKSCCVMLPGQADWFRRMADVALAALSAPVDGATPPDWKQDQAETSRLSRHEREGGAA